MRTLTLFMSRSNIKFTKEVKVRAYQVYFQTKADIAEYANKWRIDFVPAQSIKEAEEYIIGRLGVELVRVGQVSDVGTWENFLKGV